MDLINGNLRIRSAAASDAQVLCTWWNDGRVMAHAGFPHGLGISERKVIEILAQDNDMNRRLILEFEKEPIGEMSYRTTEEKVAEIGIKICETNQQNQGLGSQYLQMLLEYLFLTLAYEKVILDTNLNNARAQHVYEKLGFHKVRINVDSWQDQDGKWQSSVDYEFSRESYLRRYC